MKRFSAVLLGAIALGACQTTTATAPMPVQQNPALSMSCEQLRAERALIVEEMQVFGGVSRANTAVLSSQGVANIGQSYAQGYNTGMQIRQAQQAQILRNRYAAVRSAIVQKGCM